MKLIALLLLAAPFAYAGPWVDDRAGHGYLSLGFTEYEASKYLAGPCAGSCAGTPDSPFKATPIKYGTSRPITIPLSSGQFTAPSPQSSYTSRGASFYGEVSLWKGLGFVASMPLVSKIEQEVDTAGSLGNVAPGDLVTGLKYQVPTGAALKGFAFGPQVYMTWPTGDQNARGVYPGAFKQFNNALPIPSGNGTYDIEARLSAGYSFHPIPAFVIGEVGYHHHWDAATCSDIPVSATKKGSQSVTYSDDVPWTVQVGGTYGPKKKVKGFDHLTLIGYVHGTKSLENGFIDKSGNPAYLRPCGQANNTTFSSAGGQVMVFPTKGFGVTYSVEHVLAGGNVGYGLTNTLGVAAQF